MIVEANPVEAVGPWIVLCQFTGLVVSIGPDALAHFDGKLKVGDYVCFKAREEYNVGCFERGKPSLPYMRDSSEWMMMRAFILPEDVRAIFPREPKP